MKAAVLFQVAFMVILSHFRLSEGHGHLMDPPARSSMWREGFKTPPNYNDNQLNCGGFYNQWGVNDGKCGICGDPYQNSQPRDNESGGKYGKGIITRTYQEGQVVTLKILITANHLGWFEFRLCPDGSPNVPVTQSCLDRYVLQMADGSGTRFDLGTRYNAVTTKVKLPDGVTCKQCVLQWRWHVGNSVGMDAQGNWCKGCGAQEEFYGCADVAITSSGQTIQTSTPRPLAPITYAPVTNAPVTVAPNTPRPVYTFPPFTFRPVTNAPVTSGPKTTQRPYLTFPPATFRPITNAPVTFAPVTVAPNTPRPVYTLPPFTFRPVTNAPVTPDPQNTPPPYLTFPPATYRPVTNAPVNPQTARPVYPTFRPISFPYFTTSPTATPRPTNAAPYSTIQPIRTQYPSSGKYTLPTGFVPISIYPGLIGPTRAPVNPQTSQPTPRFPIFRPPTTSGPKISTFLPIVYTPSRPQTTPRPQNVITTRRPTLPTNFFRPPTTPRPQPAFTVKPPTTPRPTVMTTRPNTQPVTYKPIVFTLVRHTTTSPPPTTKPTTQPPRRTTSKPSIFTMAPQMTPSPTQQPMRPITAASRCFGINSWQGVPELDAYCNAECQVVHGECPAAFCACA